MTAAWLAMRRCCCFAISSCKACSSLSSSCCSLSSCLVLPRALQTAHRVALCYNRIVLQQHVTHCLLPMKASALLALLYLQLQMQLLHMLHACQTTASAWLLLLSVSSLTPGSILPALLQSLAYRAAPAVQHPADTCCCGWTHTCNQQSCRALLNFSGNPSDQDEAYEAMTGSTACSRAAGSPLMQLEMGPDFASSPSFNIAITTLITT